MIIFAHRGASGYAPENTMAAMRKAIELGSRAIELDIHNVEGELYVFHDRRLDNVSSGTGLIEKVSRSYLDSINVAGEPIPTLWQVMEYLSEYQCTVNIELKGLNSLVPFITIYTKLIEELQFPPEDLLISSFNHQQLLQFRQRFPHAYLAPLFEGITLNYIDTIKALNAYSIHLSLSFINEEMISLAHAEGSKVFVYTVDNSADMVQIAQIGVDGIFTNFPDKAMKLLSSS
ncbi:glycerophosphodiester phosphodiesterase family protein [Shewanella sp. UCD-KL12]|uniref:glycerophosphodiester phosphodiesterase n=1 Tax=Shewanella sp. UCD-KL12 TaxID=1917163 RepID=UPI000970F0E8|nr:glycerophosphodiester phosphodiesterase family protein [Shewanella sp. UCD-KL12]